MCKFNNPDCFNCPYVDCNASIGDIRRQWHANSANKARDNIDMVQITVGRHVVAKPLGTSYIFTKSYEKTDKAKERRARYYQSEKGRETQRRYNSTEKGKERWRRYYRRKKLQEAVSDARTEL